MPRSGDPGDSDADTLHSVGSDYRSYFQNAPVGHFVFDHEGRIVDLNLMACQMLDCTREELFSTSLSEIETVSIGKHPDMEHLFQQVRQHGTETAEMRVRHDGERIIDLRIEVVKLPNGHYLAYCNDITDQKRTKRKLNEQRQKYTTLVEQSHDGVVIIINGEIVFANSQIEHLTGKPVAELVGTPFETMVVPERRDEVRSKYESRIRGEDVISQYDTEIISVGGERRTVSVKASVINYRGEPAVLATLRDVSKRVQMEERLREQNEKLELFNEIIRHDIRNDMNIILGNASLLREQLSDSETTKHLDTITERSEHAVELTGILRELTKVMAETSERRQSVDLVAILEEAISAAVTSTSLSVSSDFSATSLHVVADTSLEIVFNNLLQNVATHTLDSQPVAEVSIEESEGVVTIRIADNGPGIADEAKERLFGRGEKGPKSPGTGIGLYLVDRLVNSYGGEVWIEDNEPSGAVFVVQLQRARRVA